jgi:AmmeMemoRadiSam system protein B
MKIIEEGDPVAFTKYLSKTGNTICGRHPIGVFLQAARRSGVGHSIKFTQYDQSHQCLTQRDSSVSYASAAVWIDEEEDAGAGGS